MELFTNKKVLINQPYFLGDIIFVMALIQKLVTDGYEVIYPVRDEYMNLQKNFPTVNMVALSRFSKYEHYNRVEPLYVDNEYQVISLRHSFTRKGLPYHMNNKYECMGLPVDMWRDIKIIRDFETENKLFNVLELKSDEKYNLINKNHRPFFRNNGQPIIVENGFRNITMEMIEGFSLLDWIGVMEKAQSIHTVATSNQYLMETIPTMPKEMHIYRRYNENNNTYWDHSSYEFLFKGNYIWH